MYPIQILSKEKFPSLLHEIPSPPTQLYLRGSLPNPQTKVLCVVGSRNYSRYARDACESLIKGLAGHDIAIVSGLAIGIDAIAHRAALHAGLMTIAVPGSGLTDNVLYPRSNTGLARAILDAGGGLLSEFEPEFKTQRWCFHQRNRILAGMAHATLVIEAGKQSGTLITSKFATDFNRDVMTVPGSIFSKNSFGPHQLIRLGATPVTRSEDILEVFGLEHEQNKAVHTNLTQDEESVVALLQEPLPKQVLLEQLSISTQEANVILSILEIKGIITESGGIIRLQT